MKNIENKIIVELLNADPISYRQFLNLKKKLAGRHRIPPLQNAQLIAALNNLDKKTLAKYNHKTLKKLREFLIKRSTRTLSGVTPLTVLTKPFWCPGNCVYCPLEPGMPKSYLSNEPAAQRAKTLNFDPARQTKMRIKALEQNGHLVDKIELLVLGGSWSVYETKYQNWFIKRCFDVCNGKTSKNLKEAQKLNEKAKYRIIGMTLETRPDLIDQEEIKKLRQLGCTRIQMGVQHLDNKILKYIRRGHSVEQTAMATKLLKRAGFKVDYHLMPDLPGSTPKKDLEMFASLFNDERFKPDQLKIYPTVVNEYAPLYQWYRSGKYKPYSEKQLFNLLLKIKQLIPYYVRINRLIRDIPKESITAGNKITNLRQALQKKLTAEGKKCRCMRCREAKENTDNLKKAKLFTKKYRASAGTEYFISYESPKRDKLYSFMRFRINDDWDNEIPELTDAALVRELHTYGQLLPVKSKNKTGVQHSGFGKKLMTIAEELAKKHHLKKIAVISGIGVRAYYRKLGYRLKGSYMVKNLK